MTIEQMQETTDYLVGLGFENPTVGIVLGSGLGQLVTHMDVVCEVPYGEIPHFPVSTVEFHQGKLLYGRIGPTPVVAMQGRFHYYEGYNLRQVTFPIRVMKQLGIRQLLLSNASGGLRPHLRKGSLVLIEDHIDLLPDNPLRGPNLDTLGPRFPDMSQPYDPALGAALRAAAERQQTPLLSGVYAAVAGPNLETRAEYRYLQTIGADLVGMSTVPEVIVANHMGLPCAAISVVTDECDPDHLQPIDIREIIAIATAADQRLSALLVEVIAALSEAHTP